MPASIQNASDSDLIQIAQQMLNAVTPDPAAFGLTASYVTDLAAKISTFKTDLTEQIAAQAKAKSKTTAKNASHNDLEEHMLSGKNISKAAGTSASLIASLGLPVGSSKAPSAATIPIGQVDTSSRMRHVICWTDAATPDNKRRPRGVLGCEIWVKIGEPAPGNEKDCRFLTVDAATPYIADHVAEDAGKMAHYMLRWRMRDGSTSAWSETISATITG